MYDVVIDEKDGVKVLVEFMERCESDLGKLMKEYSSNKKSFSFEQVVDFAG